jgi:hypothetical protein
VLRADIPLPHRVLPPPNDGPRAALWTTEKRSMLLEFEKSNRLADTVSSSFQNLRLPAEYPLLPRPLCPKCTPSGQFDSENNVLMNNSNDLKLYCYRHAADPAAAQALRSVYVESFGNIRKWSNISICRE